MTPKPAPMEISGKAIESLFYDEILDTIGALTNQLPHAMRKGPVNTDEIEKHETIIQGHKVLVAYFKGILDSK